MARTISMDIFGREKMPNGLDNRKGAGSYDRDMTTLYVHYGGAGHYAVPQLRHLLLQVGSVSVGVQSILLGSTAVPWCFCLCLNHCEGVQCSYPTESKGNPSKGRV